eukprot:Gb_34492 [translate_table: standard]
MKLKALPCLSVHPRDGRAGQRRVLYLEGTPKGRGGTTPIHPELGARLLQNPTHVLTSFLFHSTLWNVIPALIEINSLPHPLNLEWLRRGKVPSGRDSWEQIQWKRGL